MSSWITKSSSASASPISSVLKQKSRRNRKQGLMEQGSPFPTSLPEMEELETRKKKQNVKRSKYQGCNNVSLFSIHKMSASLIITLFLITIITAVPIKQQNDGQVGNNESTYFVRSSRTGSRTDLQKNGSSSSFQHVGCASPEVLVNGSPSPEIVETVGGGGHLPTSGSGSSQASSSSGFGSIEEIQFVGIIDSSNSSSNSNVRRICRIKCLNGVWVGPLCTLEEKKDEQETETKDKEKEITKDVIECPPIDPFLDPTKHVATKVSTTMSSDGQQKSGHKINDKIHFSCLQGFTIVPNSGPQDIVCTSTGQWSHSPPSCIPIQCLRPEVDDINLAILDFDPLTAVANNVTKDGRQISSFSAKEFEEEEGTLKKIYDFSSKIYFSCRNGYKLSPSSSSSATCIGNNEWSPNIPTCEEIKCPKPIVPMNGEVIEGTGSYNVGDYIEYNCNHGHVLFGSNSAVCTNNGIWSVQSPQCEPICEFPGEPGNGYIVPTKFQYNIGDEVTIFCKYNNDPHPVVPFIYCNEQGQWSQSLPKTCPDVSVDAEEEMIDSTEYI